MRVLTKLLASFSDFTTSRNNMKQRSKSGSKVGWYLPEGNTLSCGTFQMVTHCPVDNNYWPKPGAKNLFCYPVVNDLFNGRCYTSFEQLGPGKQSKQAQASLSWFRTQMTKALTGIWDQYTFKRCRYPVFVLWSHGNRIIATPPWTGSSSIAELLPALYRPYRSFAFTHLSQWRSTSQSLFSVKRNRTMSGYGPAWQTSSVFSEDKW